jgi:3-dehydroquinate synthetase
MTEEVDVRAVRGTNAFATPDVVPGVRNFPAPVSRNTRKRSPGDRRVPPVFAQQAERGRNLAVRHLLPVGHEEERHPTGAVSRYEITFGHHQYGFYVGEGSQAWSVLVEQLTALEADRFAVVSEPGVPSHFARELVERISRDVGPAVLLRFPPGERGKTVAAVDDLAEGALRAGLTRRSCVVAFGGGLAGNVAGLLAALLFRGIRLVHAPTTLLAMSDSVLSLKQAVNSGVGKNHIGTFHAPEFVWNNLAYLDSLPSDEIRGALCETIKNVVAICPERLGELAGTLDASCAYTADDFRRIIDICVEAKTSVMRADPQEKREALILEYGHTIGHAVELLSRGTMTHGLAVGIGMLTAARAARLLGVLDERSEWTHWELLESNGAPTALPAGVAPGRVLELSRLDNKRGYLRERPGHRDMILLEGIGQPLRSGSSLLTQVPEQILAESLHAVAPAVAA